eukprot:8756824-Ditylum_brightwellii.AAC.1
MKAAVAERATAKVDVDLEAAADVAAQITAAAEIADMEEDATESVIAFITETQPVAEDVLPHREWWGRRTLLRA